MKPKSFLLVIIVASIPFAYSFDSEVGLFAQTKESCQSGLTLAEAFYNEAKYDSALSLLHNCLSKGLKQPEKVKAYKLLGKVNVASGNIAAAKEAFRETLKLAPLTNLDPQQETPEIIELFEQVKIEFLTANESPAESKNWPWIAVAGAVVVTVGALLFLKN